MWLKNILEDQMAAPLRLFIRFPPPWMVVLIAPFLVLVALIIKLGFFISVFITSMALIVSFFFTLSKQKPVDYLVEKVVEEKVLHQKLCSEDASKSQHVEREAEEEEGVLVTLVHNNLAEAASPVSSRGMISENECIDHLSTSSDDDSEVDWSFGDNVVRSPDCSDGSISDEDSLIEIALPGGFYVGHKEQESICKKPGLLHKSTTFQQHTLLELFAEMNIEMNEEENFIEIDLSMGSIKYSRFEIEA